MNAMPLNLGLHSGMPRLYKTEEQRQSQWASGPKVLEPSIPTRLAQRSVATPGEGLLVQRSARLIERAKAEGFYWSANSPILAKLAKLRPLGGAEHQVFKVGAPGNEVVYRVTDNGLFGHRSDIAPEQYLARLEDYKRTFPDLQMRLIGVSDSPDIEGHAAIWTVQPFVDGSKFQTQALLSEAMARRGWKEDGYPGVPRFKHEASGTIISDAHIENVFQDDRGELFPFDVVVEALPRALEFAEG